MLDGNHWERVRRVIFSTVVPPLDTVLHRVCAGLPNTPACLSINASLGRDFELDLPFPDQLGADRLANVAGALSLSSPTTEAQVQSGVLHGYEALIEGLTDRLLTDVGFSAATLVATGGCINLISLSPRFRIEPDLTLLGLLRYGQRNQ